MGYNVELLPLALASYAASALIFLFRDRIARASNSYWSAGPGHPAHSSRRRMLVPVVIFGLGGTAALVGGFFL